MTLSDLSVRRPVLATVFSLIIIAFGAIAFTRLPLRELPDVDRPVVSVNATYPGASAQTAVELFERGAAYDPAELHALQVPMRPIVEQVITDPSDPSYAFRDYEAWQADFEERLAELRATPAPDPHDEMPPHYMRPEAPPVGVVTEESLRAFEKGLRVAEKKAAKTGVAVEHVRTQLPVIDS